MSRSYRKHPGFGLSSGKMSPWKRRVNRQFRRREKQVLHMENFESLPINLNEIEGLWASPCDGKIYWSNILHPLYRQLKAIEWMRKDCLYSDEYRDKMANWFLHNRWRNK